MVCNIFPLANFLCRRQDAGLFNHWMELGRQAVRRLAKVGLVYAGWHTEPYNRPDLVTVPVINASYATGGGTGAKIGAVLNHSLNNGLSARGLR